MLCAALGCSDEVAARGLCATHYARAKNRVNKEGRSVKEISDAILLEYAQEHGGNGQCELSGCNKQARAKGLCERHYRNAMRKAELKGLNLNKMGRDRVLELAGDYSNLVLARAKERNPCRVDGCNEPEKIRGFCDRHYTRVAMRARYHGGSVGDMTDQQILEAIGSPKV